MTTDIKEYKQLLTIELKDGTMLNTDKTLQQLQDYMSKGSDFITIDGVMFNKYEFKKAYERKIDGVESFILSQSKELQQKIKDRQEQMYKRVGRRFETIEEVQNYITSLA